MPTRIRTVLQIPMRQGFTYPAASLEGLPPSVKLEIMLKLDLPSLCRLKLASREYYFAAGTYPHHLQRANKKDILAREERSYSPWLDDSRAHVQQRPQHRVYNFDTRPHGRWLPEFHAAFIQAVHDWQKLELDDHYEWQVPGRRGFSFGVKEWIIARMYNLTSEYIARRHVSSHIQVLTGQFLNRYERMELTNGDVDLGKILAVLCRGQKYDQLVARLEVMQAELLPTSEEAGLTFEEIIEQRNEKKGFELILDLLTSKRHLTRRLLQSLEVAGMIERTDGEWRLSKQFEDAT